VYLKAYSESGSTISKILTVTVLECKLDPVPVMVGTYFLKNLTEGDPASLIDASTFFKSDHPIACSTTDFKLSILIADINEDAYKGIDNPITLDKITLDTTTTDTTTPKTTTPDKITLDTVTLASTTLDTTTPDTTPKQLKMDTTVIGTFVIRITQKLPFSDILTV
jgi:hypothetical protein